MLRPRQVFEAVLSEIDELAFRYLVTGRPRRDDLAAVRNAGDPRRTMDVHADIPLAGQNRLAGVHADSDADRTALERSHRLLASCNGV